MSPTPHASPIPTLVAGAAFLASIGFLISFPSAATIATTVALAFLTLSVLGYFGEQTKRQRLIEARILADIETAAQGGQIAVVPDPSDDELDPLGR